MDDHALQQQLAHWGGWVGRSERRHEVVGPAPLAGLAATLDHDTGELQPGADIPPLAHWLYFLPTVRQSLIGTDGHARRGDFLPPVTLPRRMWAGGRLEFMHPLRVGEPITRESRILSVQAKRGRSGALVFVTVRHEITDAHGLALTEEHDIVYRDLAPAAVRPALPAPGDEAFARTIVPDPVLLFRYSALTFNGHRIHFDRRYATEVEGYPGLVVHGPLIATLLVDLLQRERPQARLRRYAYTALAPAFDIDPITLCGHDDGNTAFALWARSPDGACLMRAQAQVA